MANEKRRLQDALMRLATGCEYEEKEIILDKNGRGTGKVKVTKKYLPPSMAAIRNITRMIESGEWESD